MSEQESKAMPETTQEKEMAEKKGTRHFTVQKWVTISRVTEVMKKHFTTDQIENGVRVATVQSFPEGVDALGDDIEIHLDWTANVITGEECIRAWAYVVDANEFAEATEARNPDTEPAAPDG